MEDNEFVPAQDGVAECVNTLQDAPSTIFDVKQKTDPHFVYEEVNSSSPTVFSIKPKDKTKPHFIYEEVNISSPHEHESKYSDKIDEIITLEAGLNKISQLFKGDLLYDDFLELLSDKALRFLISGKNKKLGAIYVPDMDKKDGVYPLVKLMKKYNSLNTESLKDFASIINQTFDRLDIIAYVEKPGYFDIVMGQKACFFYFFTSNFKTEAEALKWSEDNDWYFISEGNVKIKGEEFECSRVMRLRDIVKFTYKVISDYSFTYGQERKKWDDLSDLEKRELEKEYLALSITDALRKDINIKDNFIINSIGDYLHNKQIKLALIKGIMASFMQNQDKSMLFLDSLD